MELNSQGMDFEPFVSIMTVLVVFQLSVDTSVIEYGTSVIGETLKRTFTLRNNGALRTTFDFYKITGLKQRSLTTAETSLGRLVCTF